LRRDTLSEAGRSARVLLAGSAVAGALLVYGGVNVLLEALVLSAAIHPPPAGGVDRTALHWHAGIWDLWLLVWGSCWRWLLLAIGAGWQRDFRVMGQLTSGIQR